MFLFITTSDNFSAPHKRPLHPRMRGKDGRHPSRGYLHPHGQREAMWPSGLALFRLLNCNRRQRSSMRLVVVGGSTPLPRTHIEIRVSRIERGNTDTGHRLPAWLRPGTKWPPGKNGLPLPHLVLGRLGEGHVVSCDGIHPLVSAAWPSVPTGARSDPRNQRRGACRPARSCSPLGLWAGVPARLPG